MAAGPTYEPIATQTLGANAASVTFSSISQSYTDLVLVITGGQVTADGAWFIQVGNGSIDTATNYSGTQLVGNGSTATSNRSATSSSITALSTNSSSTNDNILINLMNYSNTSTYKTILFRGNSTEYRVATTVGLWRSTSAINQIKIYGFSNLLTGSTFTLYGILSA
jgi:hypothetical protein